ncbi:MAG: hypothetical protein IPN26_15560 [Bacteroidetes bacterium]|nr:hypothetical protein [Bacteroidota bacterium]
MTYRYSGTNISTTNYLRSLGNLTTPTIVNNGSHVQRFDFYGYDGSDYQKNAQILVSVDGNPALGSIPGRITFSTTTVGASTPTEVMRITNGQEVGINTTSPNTRIDINGNIAVRQNGTSLVNGANHNLNTGEYSFIRITGPTAAFSITGLADGTDGEIITLFNQTAFNLTIANANIGSLVANRILTLTGADISTTGQGTVTLQYSSADSRWIVIAIRD